MKLIIICISIIFLYSKAYCKDQVLFTINNLTFTNIDLEKRINYFLLINKLENNNDNFKLYYQKETEQDLGDSVPQSCKFQEANPLFLDQGI